MAITRRVSLRYRQQTAERRNSQASKVSEVPTLSQKKEHPISQHAPGVREPDARSRNALVRSLAELGGVDRKAERRLDARADC